MPGILLATSAHAPALPGILELTGQRLDPLGVVRGVVVRATTISQGIRGAFSGILGGHVKAYEEVC